MSKNYPNSPATDMSTCLLIEENECFTKSKAITETIKYLTIPWRWFYYPVKMVPRAISDKIYTFIGRNRYKLFGRRELTGNKECCKFE